MTRSEELGRAGAASEVERSRREVERRLHDVRTSIVRETGILPKAKYAILGIAAAAAGFALASKRRNKRRNKDR